jgi:hypothetical protein
MTELADADRALNERVGNVPRILEVMNQAVREALLDHKRAGNPVAIWRNEQVVWIQPEDISTEFDDEPAAR